MERLKGVMAREFEIKDLGPLRYFLRMEVARSRNSLLVSQQKYTLELLKKIGMLDCKLADTPMDQNKKNKTRTLADKGRYQRLVGKLIYLSHTQSNIAFAMCGKSIHACPL